MLPCQCVGDERFLLALVKDVKAGRRRGGALASRVAERSVVVERRLQAMADLVPGALVLRLFLAPDDVARLRVAVEYHLVVVRRERVQLLDADDGRFRELL